MEQYGCNRRKTFWLVLSFWVIYGAFCGCVGADSLFNSETEKRGSLIADNQRRFNVGDIITVMVRETIDANTQSDTRTKKESDVNAKAPATQNEFLIAETPGGLNIIPKEQLPNWNIGVNNEHKARGQTLRKNSLLTTIACTVKRVHENGNLDIEGQKKVSINREESAIFVSGTIRSRDVTPANTVESTQVANAVVELKGNGPLWNNQRRGLITRLLDWFSPF
ncbi:MAG TPA: flagellar basal body L-ring protein FlgH [Candidatus Hydrogenedentes bacterium]|nr:flagellar basal body L-ring protein FlgH [Candidatus Hydrogenedentota bacterium]HOL77479.1 flagellar basal body L-ring protein FlgH [Candidatus Hydrogenedentota bacterium]HPO86274.1 flagellar basal body L-ring protein FlgH [Candidatus Hydrogenedentota bacterium]